MVYIDDRLVEKVVNWLDAIDDMHHVSSIVFEGTLLQFSRIFLPIKKQHYLKSKADCNERILELGAPVLFGLIHARYNYVMLNTLIIS